MAATRTQFEERAALGAALLDEKEAAGWADRVEISGAMMAHPCKCVLGQLHGRYQEGLILVGMQVFGLTGAARDEPWRYGFTLRPDESFEHWYPLGKAWQREIERRRS
jgi:hypothetical protein